MKPLLSNEESSDDSDCERPAMALNRSRIAILTLRNEDAHVDIEHESMYGALMCYDHDDDHGARDTD